MILAPSGAMRSLEQGKVGSGAEAIRVSPSSSAVQERVRRKSVMLASPREVMAAVRTNAALPEGLFALALAADDFVDNGDRPATFFDQQ